MESAAAVAAPGALLARMLDGNRTFMRSIYGLMRLLEDEATKRGWQLVKPGSYSVTRNGKGSGLSTWGKVDWVPNTVALCFVRPGTGQVDSSSTSTPIPASGLDVLLFQVRWLEKSPKEPVVLHARLTARLDGTTEWKRWEDWQTWTITRVEPEPQPIIERAGEIKPIAYNEAYIVTGRYF